MSCSSRCAPRKIYELHSAVKSTSAVDFVPPFEELVKDVKGDVGTGTGR